MKFNLIFLMVLVGTDLVFIFRFRKNSYPEELVRLFVQLGLGLFIETRLPWAGVTLMGAIILFFWWIEWRSRHRQRRVTYPNPEARRFSEWLMGMGLICEGTSPEDDGAIVEYDEFVTLSNKCRLVKTSNGPLYGFWRKYGFDQGEARTVREWLDDFKWTLVDPTPEELNDLNLFLGHDAFWKWSSGKVDTLK